MTIQPLPLRTALGIHPITDLVYLACLLGVAAPSHAYSRECLLELIESQLGRKRKPLEPPSLPPLNLGKVQP